MSTTDVWDIDAIGEALNNKIDLPSNQSQADVDYVVESKYPTAEDPTWYRLYKSGWCEQGGSFDKGSLSLDSTHQISFVKSFKNTRYTLVALLSRNDGVGSAINNQVFVTKRNENNFTARCYGDGSSQYIDWRATGMII